MPDPVRVLHLIGSLGLGGAETILMNVFRRIDRSRILFDAVVYAATPEYYEGEFRGLGGRVFRVPYPNARGIAGHCRELRRVLRESGPYAAVHSHIYYYSGFGLSGARLAGVPVRIAHSHNTSDGRPTTALRRSYRELMRALIHTTATHLAGCSKPACAALFGKRCAQARILRNAIDPGCYPADWRGTRASVRSALNLSQDDFVLAHAGNFSPAKNHVRLLEIFADVVRAEPRARLLLIGQGALRAGIEQRCRVLGLERSVGFLGARDDVPRVLSACDGFVFPSLYEGLPVAVVEAQMAGLPCYVSEAVPGEADLGLGLLRPLALAEPPAKWAEAVLAARWQERLPWENRQRALQMTGFDIRQAVHEWEALYLPS